MDKLYSMAEKTNDFFNSFKVIIILSLIGTLFAVLELVLFFTGNASINGLPWDTSTSTVQLVVTVFAVILSMVSLYLGFFVGVANTRKSWYASYLSIAIMIIAIIVDVMSGFWLVTIELGIAIPMVMYRRNFWNNERYKEDKFQLNVMWPYLLLVFFGSCVLFYGLVGLWGDEIYSTSLFPFMPPANEGDTWKYYFDATVAVLGTMGNFCIIFRWRLSYIWWTISKFFLITLFFTVSGYVQISQQVIFIFIDMGTVLAMTHQKKLHDEQKSNS